MNTEKRIFEIVVLQQEKTSAILRMTPKNIEGNVARKEIPIGAEIEAEKDRDSMMMRRIGDLAQVLEGGDMKVKNVRAGVEGHVRVPLTGDTKLKIVIEAEIALDLAAVKATGGMIGRELESELSIGTAGAGAGADLLRVVDTVGVTAPRIEGVQVADTR